MTEWFASSDGEISSEQALDIYRVMLTIRSFESAAADLLAGGRLPGFLHLSIGQEGVAAGVCSALGPEDGITTTHRGHGHCIAKGGSVDRMMAELFGRGEGYCKGRSGSMHIMDADAGILGAHAIVGAGLPMAVGAAYSAKVRGERRVAVAFFGEGAVGEGVFHESLNLAALWSLPVVFVCENNRYAELSHVSMHLSAKHVADFGAPYGIPAATLDGNDVLAVASAARKAVGRARDGGGPTLLEFETYRWRGHFEGDPQRYRSRDEVASWQARDPVARFQERLEAGFAVDVAELDRIEREASTAVERAVEWAESLPPAPPTSLLEDVYRSGSA
ncbi:MAG: ABC transporter substrate-binding protein [Streptosporangiales bacterium]|nr:ABC transporter substrate-binding protein [Streptosporangiales bacterium]